MGASMSRYVSRNRQGGTLAERDDPQVTKSLHRTLVYVGLAYLFFVIYGSLVPLEFHARSWDGALQAFMNIPYLDLGIGSRADWVANILLFIPLAFIWLGIFGYRKKTGLRIYYSAVVLILAVALDVGIEFTQLFFPQRTVSLNDIIAESMGACIGVLLWWVYGEKLMSWLGRWSSARGNSGSSERFLHLYLFGLFTYNLLPLDLTLSPVELYHKWNEGRVILIPFGFNFDNLQDELYGLISDVAIWVPVGFLWRLSSKRSVSFIFFSVISASFLLEFLQLFVYTRVTNVTQIFAAGFGAVIGLIVSGLSNRKGFSGAEVESAAANGIFSSVAWWAATLVWTMVIIAVFWYPFDFHFSQAIAAQHLPNMFRVPFYSYYYGSEYRAATEVIHKIGFFLPLGVLLGYGVSHIRDYFWRPIAGGFAIFTLGLLALGIELGQLFLPTKNADITDLILELSGGLMGYFVTTLLRTRAQRPDRPGEAVSGRRRQHVSRDNNHA